MECQSSDSKKVFKVFDGSKRKSTRKKEGLDDTNSHATDDSVSLCRPSSRKSSHQNIVSTDAYELQDQSLTKREREISPAMSRSPEDGHRHAHSPRRHRRGRQGLSLALKSGLISTPRTDSPVQDRDGTDTLPQDQDSFIYAFLEETLKRDKKKHRHSHSHRREERRRSRDRDASAPRDHRHCRRKSHVSSRDREKPKEVAPTIDQAMLFETFAKICSQLNEKSSAYNKSYQQQETMARSTSHKSLQCEVTSKHNSYDVDCQPVRLRSHEQSREAIPNRIRSQESFASPRAREKISEIDRNNPEKCMCFYDKDQRYTSKADMTRSKMDNRYGEYPPVNVQTRCCIDTYKNRPPDPRDYRDYEKNQNGRYYEDEKRKCAEQKTSRSFDIRPEPYAEDRCCRRTVRSENNKERCYDERDKRYEEKYYDAKPTESRHPGRMKEPCREDRRWKRNLERFERNSVASREDFRDRERDRFSERERDSGLSVADGEMSTVSGRSNCLKVVKQEIAEQREAMDKMMKLWKELMRCFKGLPQTQVQQNKAVHDSAASARDSAAAQMRLWQECMRRYETVARDVGDTDARLMEEIKKQRCEMAEMANMWQECLQRYRDMSNDFNNLKQKLATSEPPTHDGKPSTAPLVCAEVEGSVPPPHYRLPPNYPPQGMPSGYAPPGSPLRTRASAPPAWWWCDPARSPRRRRSSPDSRASRERDRDRERDHRHRTKEEPRGYKQKHSKPNATRSEHRHRKR